MLYTRKGDTGTTKIFGCNQSLSKSSAVAEALGALDEVNSFLGIVKTHTAAPTIVLDDKKLPEIIHLIQENLFIVQAEVAGADKHLEQVKIKEIEDLVDSVEKILPPIKSFFISGGTSIAAHLDTARTITRRAERRVVAVSEEGSVKVDALILAYLNRLSSLLYALARLSNHLSGITEQSPKY